MTHNTRELEEKYWNSKPKKKVTGEGVVVSLSKNEFNELLSNFHHQLQKAREEERERIATELDRYAHESHSSTINIKHLMEKLVNHSELDQDKK